MVALLRRARAVAPQDENDFEMFSNESTQQEFETIAGSLSGTIELRPGYESIVHNGRVVVLGSSAATTSITSPAPAGNAIVSGTGWPDTGSICPLGMGPSSSGVGCSVTSGR